MLQNGESRAPSKEASKQNRQLPTPQEHSKPTPTLHILSLEGLKQCLSVKISQLPFTAGVVPRLSAVDLSGVMGAIPLLT